MRSPKYKVPNTRGLFLVPRSTPDNAMSVPKSQQMSWYEVTLWSVLSGVVVVVVSMVVAWLLPAPGGGSAFRDFSTSQVFACGAGVFLLGTVVVFGFLAKVKWMEQESPAKIADQIERKLKG